MKDGAIPNHTPQSLQDQDEGTSHVRTGHGQTGRVRIGHGPPSELNLPQDTVTELQMWKRRRRLDEGETIGMGHWALVKR